MCKGMCTCGVLVHVGQRSTSGFIPQARATLFFETEFLAGLDLTKQVRQAGQAATEICLSLPPQYWDHKDISPHLTLSYISVVRPSINGRAISPAQPSFYNMESGDQTQVLLFAWQEFY